VSDLAPALLGALALIGIPIVAWLSQRVTREGRLLGRLRRLGTVYNLLPDSPEKDTFGAHITSVVSDLNAWIDSETLQRRVRTRLVWSITYSLGVAGSITVAVAVGKEDQPWLSFAIGLGFGVVITAVASGLTWMLDRRSQERAAKEANRKAEAAAAERIESLRSLTRP